MELNEFCPPNRSDDLCLFFCTNPYLCLRGNDVKVRHCDKTGYFFPFTVKIVFVFIFLISVLLFFHLKNMFVNNKQLTKTVQISYEYKCSSKIYDRGCFAIIWNRIWKRLKIIYDLKNRQKKYFNLTAFQKRNELNDSNRQDKSERAKVKQNSYKRSFK